MGSLHRVLAVDDNPRNLAIIQRTLGNEFNVVTAGSGEEALEIAQRYHPDLVLLDLMMPGIDGYETCRRLRELPRLSGCKIIMVSARATTADRLEGYAAGANDYVTKPFDPDELVAKLQVYLRLRSIEEVDRLKSDLLGLLSHETRTPLTTILSPAALLLDDPELSSDQRELVSMIQAGGIRLLSLIEKVSYLSQLKAGLLPQTQMTLHSDVLISRAVATARSKVSRDDVTIELPQGAGVQIQGDADQLGLALEALLDNGLRVSPPSGTIRVEVQYSGPWSIISVTDQGPGVAPELRDRVFEEFFVENVQNHSRGHGLSLSTARLILEQHGGSLLLSSQAGAGATFQILLPSLNAGELAA